MGVWGILGEDAITRNLKIEDDRDYHLSSPSVESSESLCTSPLYLAPCKNCLERKVKYESLGMIGAKRSSGNDIS